MMTTPNDQIVSKKLLHNRVIVVDDFYADPYAIREIALTAEYEEKVEETILVVIQLKTSGMMI